MANYHVRIYSSIQSCLHQKDILVEGLKERDARRKEAELAWKERQRELWCSEEELSPRTKDEINNVRTKLFWVYQTRDPKEFKVRFVTFLLWISWESFGRAESSGYLNKIMIIIIVFLSIVVLYYLLLTMYIEGVAIYHIHHICLCIYIMFKQCDD